MLESTTLLLEKAAISKKLRSDRYAVMTGQETDFAQRQGEIRTMYDQVDGLETRIVGALDGESASAGKAFGAESAEHRERTTITGRADLGVLVGHIVNRRALQVGSAEAEAQAAWDLPGDAIPISMLAEYRVAAAPADGGGGQSFVGYRFPNSIASFANVTRPRVAPGTPVFPSITSASVAGRPAEAAQNVDSDPTLRGELLTPKRVQANTKISVEDRARFGGMAAAIAQHLAGAVAAGYDQQALLGDDGFFDGTSGPLTEPPAPGAASTYANYSAMISGSVDGRYAPSEAQVGLLVGMDTFNDGALLYRTTNSQGHLMEDLGRRGRLQVSAAIPAKSGNVQSVLVVRGTAPAAVQPLWDGLTIEDLVTRSEYGEITFTIVGLSDFSVTQPSAYAWAKADVR